MHSAGEERSIVIESDLYRVQISNRGATVRSWQLTNSPTIILRREHSTWFTPTLHNKRVAGLFRWRSMTRNRNQP